MDRSKESIGLSSQCLTKLSLDDPEKWYKHVTKLQEAINTTFQRSIGRSPFELMFGVQARRSEDFKLREVIQEEYIQNFEDERFGAREAAKQQIRNVQDENRRQFDKKRRPSK